MRKINPPSTMNRLKSFISPLSGRSLGIEDSRPEPNELTANQENSNGVVSGTDSVTVAVKGVISLLPDVDDLPSADGTISANQKIAETSDYSEEVIEALQELPRLPDIDINTVPQYYLNTDSSGIKRDNNPEEASATVQQEFEEMLKTINMANINQSLTELMAIEGAMAVAVVDSKSGMMLGSSGGGLNLDVAAAGNSEVIRSKMKVMANLGLKDTIEDILITLGSQYHLIRPTAEGSGLFIYLVLNRAQANLAMARHKLTSIEAEMKI